MSISLVFTFAPIPLTQERSPLAHAAAIVRRRLADNPVVAVPRHRIRPPVEKTVEKSTEKTVEKKVAEVAVA